MRDVKRLVEFVICMQTDPLHIFSRPQPTLMWIKSSVQTVGLAGLAVRSEGETKLGASLEARTLSTGGARPRLLL